MKTIFYFSFPLLSFFLISCNSKNSADVRSIKSSRNTAETEIRTPKDSIKCTFPAFMDGEFYYNSSIGYKVNIKKLNGVQTETFTFQHKFYKVTSKIKWISDSTYVLTIQDMNIQTPLSPGDKIISTVINAKKGEYYFVKFQFKKYGIKNRIIQMFKVN